MGAMHGRHGAAARGAPHGRHRAARGAPYRLHADPGGPQGAVGDVEPMPASAANQAHRQLGAG